jgi:hypothetical protein
MSNEETTPAAEVPEAPAKKIGAPDLLNRLQARYAPPGWAFFPEFRSATGAGNERYADAIAVSVFPSRGLEIYGFEIKVSKSDLKAELNDARKADAIGKFCSHWYLVISDEKLLEGLEIPTKWGILKPRGDSLHLHKKSERNAKPAQPTIELVASLARRVSSEHFIPRNEMSKIVSQKIAEDRAWVAKTQRGDNQYKLDQAISELDGVRQRIKAFEDASGIKIDNWDAGRIGEAVKLVKNGVEAHNFAKHALSDTIRDMERSLVSLKFTQNKILNELENKRAEK